MKGIILCLLIGAAYQTFAANTSKCSEDLTVTFENSRSVSTELDQKDKTTNYGADRAHLNDTQKKDKAGVTQMGGWVAEKSDFNQFIQIELKDTALLRGLTTQGRNGCCQQWVNKYRVLYSDDCKTWHTVGGFNVTDAFFQGNKDEDTPVTNMFHCPVMAKCIRINPLGWNNNIAMRVGLLGCQLNLNGVTTTAPAVTSQAVTTKGVTATHKAVTTAAPIVTTQPPAQTTTVTPANKGGNNNGNKGKCVKDCIKRANGDYQSCSGCDVFITCNWGIVYDNRPCPKTLFWDDNKKRCEKKSTTCP